jgi:ABC-type amino acid transport system permease subunit
MPSSGFEPAIPAVECLQTYALDRTASAVFCCRFAAVSLIIAIIIITIIIIMIISYTEWLGHHSDSVFYAVRTAAFLTEIYFCLTCFGLSFSPSSGAGVQLRHWFKPAGYGVSAPDADAIPSISKQK